MKTTAPMELRLSDGGETPIYRQIADAVCRAVAAKQVQPGERLPTHMAMAKRLRVNPLTVRRAYELLQSQGVVLQRRGSGTYVQSDAVDRVRLSSKRRIANVAHVMGVPSLSMARRETLFIVTDILEGFREVLSLRDTHLHPLESLTRDCLGELSAYDAVLLHLPRAFERDQALIEEIVRSGMPVVSVWDERADPMVPHVTYDQGRTAALACQHLIDVGYRRIGFIGNRTLDQQITPKFQAFINCLHDAGLDVHARYVRHATVDPGLAFAAAKDIIQGGDLPEAIFVDTDYKAMEVIGALRGAGLSVPGDVAIVSFDDIPEAATFAPALSTVSVPRREIGRRAAQTLLDWPDNGTTPPGVVLPSTLIVRESSLKATHP